MRMLACILYVLTESAGSTYRVLHKGPVELKRVFLDTNTYDNHNPTFTIGSSLKSRKKFQLFRSKIPIQQDNLYGTVVFFRDFRVGSIMKVVCVSV